VMIRRQRMVRVRRMGTSTEDQTSAQSSTA
jgi:hypothetical protein